MCRGQPSRISERRRQCFIRTIPRKGYRFIAEVRENSEVGDPPDATPKNAAGLAAGGSSEHVKQTVTFCRTVDDVNIAVASAGCGPVVVRAAHWANDIEYDWQNLVTGPSLQRLANRFHLVRYDYRGTGLSDRDVPAISFQTMLCDLEAVVDALALERFTLLGISGGAATSIAYAVRHPHRVSKLVLFGAMRRAAISAARRKTPRTGRHFARWGGMAGVTTACFSRAPSFPSFYQPQRSSNSNRSSSFSASRSTGDPLKNWHRRPTLSTSSTCCRMWTYPRSSFTASATGLFRSTKAGVSLPRSRTPGLCRSTARTTRCAWTKFVEEMEAFLSDERQRARDPLADCDWSSRVAIRSPSR
jgi:pimeloyl-ACP methyl ester carboxylesterase